MCILRGKVISLPSKRCNPCVVDDWELEKTPNKRRAKESSSSSENSSSDESSSSSDSDSESSDVYNPDVSSSESLDAYSSQGATGTYYSSRLQLMSKSKDTSNGVTNIKRLLSTGILQGAKVTYKNQEKKLPGIISNSGYLCGCWKCNFTKLLSAVQFEQHAGCKTKNQNSHIFLENGKSLYNIFQDLKNTPWGSVKDHIRDLVSVSLLQPATSSNLVCKQKNPFSEKPKKMDSFVPKSVMGQKSITCRKKIDNGLHQLIFMPNGLPDGAELGYYASGKKLLDGYKQGDGIVCSCCDQKIRPSVFEAHAGCETKRQPYLHIFTSDGVSLHTLAISLKQSQRVASSTDQSSTPQVLERSTSLAGGSTVCRTHAYSAGKFDEQTFLGRDQCEKEYRISDNLKELPNHKQYCSKACTRIHAALEDLILNGPEIVPASVTRTLNGKSDVRWQLFSGRTNAPDHSRSPLSKAAAIFQSCFNPIPEKSSRRDLIPGMLFAREIGEMRHGGMYCDVLTVNSVVVTAAILRVLGKEAAEIPLVATVKGSQRKGYCNALVSCIESFLCGLNVENRVLPAAEQSISMWTERFGFKKMTDDDLIQCTLQ